MSKRDRDELAYEIFRADNSSQPLEENRQDWDALVICHGKTYAHHIADRLIAAGYRKEATA